MSVQAVPDGFNTVSGYLVVPNSAEALAFYEKAFGAKPGLRMEAPGGGTMHAEMHIGNSTVMMSDENPQWNMKSPKTLGGTPCSLHMYVDDCDAVFQKATEAGCEVVSPLMDCFWGDRFGKLQDPFGHQWSVATHKEDVPPEEMGKRAEEFFKSMMSGEACEGG